MDMISLPESEILFVVIINSGLQIRVLNQGPPTPQLTQNSLKWYFKMLNLFEKKEIAISFASLVRRYIAWLG